LDNGKNALKHLQKLRKPKQHLLTDKDRGAMYLGVKERIMKHVPNKTEQIATTDKEP
jgi:hypothetical protein